MKKIILSLAISFQCLAGNSVENGGDQIAAEFVQLARKSLHYLSALELSVENQKLVQTIEVSVNSTTINTAEKLVLRGEEVDAINYPQDKKIVISRDRWNKNRVKNPDIQATFVLHEYLGASGLNDQHYEISQSLVDLIRQKLHEDFISNEMVQSFLVAFTTDILLFNMDINLMKSTDLINWEAYCTNAGAFQSHMNTIHPIITSHLFWFGQDQNKVSENMTLLRKYSYEFTEGCLSKNADLDITKEKILFSDLTIKEILMKIQFPEEQLKPSTHK